MDLKIKAQYESFFLGWVAAEDICCLDSWHNPVHKKDDGRDLACFSKDNVKARHPTIGPAVKSQTCLHDEAYVSPHAQPAG